MADVGAAPAAQADRNRAGDRSNLPAFRLNPNALSFVPKTCSRISRQTEVPCLLRLPREVCSNNGRSGAARCWRGVKCCARGLPMPCAFGDYSFQSYRRRLHHSECLQALELVLAHVTAADDVASIACTSRAAQRVIAQCRLHVKLATSIDSAWKRAALKHGAIDTHCGAANVPVEFFQRHLTNLLRCFPSERPLLLPLATESRGVHQVRHCQIVTRYDCQSTASSLASCRHQCARCIADTSQK
jgi:hypothetical protein